MKIRIIKALTKLLLLKIKYLVKLVIDENKEFFDRVVFNFFNDNGYEEEHIENKLTKLIEDKRNDISSLGVFYVPNDNKITIRIYVKIKNILDSFKYTYEIDKEVIINGIRRYRLERILDIWLVYIIFTRRLIGGKKSILIN